MKRALIAASLGILGFSASGASALPAMGVPDKPETRSQVEPVASWRYHRNCGWNSGRWIVDLGGGRIVDCRPMRPGRDYVWRDEGSHHGWWHSRERRWHFNNW